MSGTAGGGERDGDREVMRRNQGDLVKSGVDPRKAEKMARESMVRVDRQLREQGKR